MENMSKCWNNEQQNFDFVVGDSGEGSEVVAFKGGAVILNCSFRKDPHSRRLNSQTESTRSIDSHK